MDRLGFSWAGGSVTEFDFASSGGRALALVTWTRGPPALKRVAEATVAAATNSSATEPTSHRLFVVIVLLPCSRNPAIRSSSLPRQCMIPAAPKNGLACWDSSARCSSVSP